MKRTLLRTFAAAAAAAALSASGFAITAAAQSDQQPTRTELVQRWAEAALDGQLKGMKTSLRLTADQEKDWGSFESAVKDAGPSLASLGQMVSQELWLALGLFRIHLRKHSSDPSV